MILDEIAAKTRERVVRCKENVRPEEMKKKALSLFVSFIGKCNFFGAFKEHFSPPQ